jgi:hypothetical protein
LESRRNDRSEEHFFDRNNVMTNRVKSLLKLADFSASMGYREMAEQFTKEVYGILYSRVSMQKFPNSLRTHKTFVETARRSRFYFSNDLQKPPIGGRLTGASLSGPRRFCGARASATDEFDHPAEPKNEPQRS